MSDLTTEQGLDDPTPAALVQRVKDALAARTYPLELLYVDHNDELRPEQVSVLLRGENEWESDEFSNIEDWEGEGRYVASTEYLKEILEDDFGVLENDVYADQEARDLIGEADTSDIVDMLLRNTPNMLMRYDLDLNVDTDWSSDEETRIAMKIAIIEHLDLPAGHPVIANLDELITEAGYGGRLWAFWYGDPADVVHAAEPLQKARYGEGDTIPTGRITFGAGFSLLVLDKLNGSGHSVRSDAPLTVDFDSERLTTDKDGNGYGWDEICGLVQSYFDADVTIDVLTWEHHDEPGHTYSASTSVLHNKATTYENDKVKYLVWPTTGTPVPQSGSRTPRFVDGWAASVQGRVKGAWLNQILGLHYVSREVAMQAAEQHERQRL